MHFKRFILRHSWLLDALILSILCTQRIRRVTARIAGSINTLFWQAAAPLAFGFRQGKTAAGLYRSELNVGEACGIGGVTYPDPKVNPTHQVLVNALGLLSGMEHRGGSTPGNPEKNGDGAGVSTDIPLELFKTWISEQGLQFRIQGERDLGVGMFFFPSRFVRRSKHIVSDAIGRVFGPGVCWAWREVPIDPAACGENADKLRPAVWQLLIERPEHLPARDFEVLLYLLERRVFGKVQKLKRQEPRHKTSWDHFFVCSLSCEAVVYKGMLTGNQLSRFYLDLQNPMYQCRKALVHERFATNTLSRWALAQPYGLLCHNGELNTIQRNVRYMRALQAAIAGDLEQMLAQRFQRSFKGVLTPFVDETLSDSGMANEAFKLFRVLGEYLGTENFTAPEYLAMMVPYAWQQDEELPEAQRELWRFLATSMPPWDGPAALFFNTGRWMGARLDRAGYRPLRWQVTDDGMVVFASEANILQTGAERIKLKRRLGPGETLVIDTHTGEILDNAEFMRRFAEKADFADLNRAIEVCGVDHAPPRPETELGEQIADGSFTGVWPRIVQCIAAGWTKDEENLFLIPATTGADPSGSMGDDAQLAALRDLVRHPTPLAYFVFERFAQVTNPAWDSVRERLIGSLRVYLGPRRSPLDAPGPVPVTLELDSPVLTGPRVEWIRARADTRTLDTTYQGSKVAAIERLCQQAEDAVSEGCPVLILSDRDIGPERRLLPALQAVSYVDLQLSKKGLGNSVRLVVETAEPMQPHTLAALLGYGASAVHPWGAFALITHIHTLTPSEFDNRPLRDCVSRYIHALEVGLLKVMAKMGITDVESYIGGRIFETFGLDPSFTSKYLGEDPQAAPVGGRTDRDIETMYDRFREIAEGCLERVEFPEDIDLPRHGRLFGQQGEIPRNFDRLIVDALQEARASRDTAAWQKFAELANNRPVPITTKDFFTPKSRPVRAALTQAAMFLGIALGMLFRGVKPTRAAVRAQMYPLGEVMERLRTSPMSYGSISPEVHEDLAIAAAITGHSSHSGEGGEYLHRLFSYFSSKGKQVASGRFGVDALYLASAEQIEIKICQGAKPGEGGALHWLKVDSIIAVCRGTLPHVTLVSPPPHHDIYSIEDLKQLIFDLKAVNSSAQIIVKLVASGGIGTVAIGVAKAGADIIQIAGFNGGTGNAPVNSIHFTGLPWEIGLAECHQALLEAGVRDHVLLGVDGGFLSGRDVIVATALGAQLYGLGTAALIAEGCVLMKRCKENVCNVGVATTDPRLRKRYTGTPAYVVNYFCYIAAEVKEYLRKMGVSSLNALVGRTDLLKITRRFDCPLDLSKLFYRPCRWKAPSFADQKLWRNRLNPVSTSVDDALLVKTRCVIEGKQDEITIQGEEEIAISTCNLSVGAKLSGEIARARRERGLPEGAIQVQFRGSAGQSFGAWLYGASFRLIGDAQDGVGKGAKNATIVVVPESNAQFDADDSVIAGNVLFYGANAGAKGFIRGAVGERCAVLNKAAEIVVEGAGWHFCEYMCGGTVVSLKPVGRNAFAGMSGGTAYVYDADDSFAEKRANTGSVNLRRLNAGDPEAVKLQEMLQAHIAETGSANARRILNDFEHEAGRFWVATAKITDERQRRMQEQAHEQYEQLLRELPNVNAYMNEGRRETIAGAARLAAELGRSLDEPVLGFPDDGTQPTRIPLEVVNKAGSSISG